MPSSRAFGRSLCRVSLLALMFPTLALAQQPAPAAPTPPPAPAPAATTPPAQPAPASLIRGGWHEPIAKPAGMLRVATFNVENLFGPAAEGHKDDAKRPAEPKPESELKALSEVIKSLDADVLALQEVESLETLTKFRDTYLKDLGYQHIVSIDSADPRGIENSVLSRFPLKDPQVWPNLPLGNVHPAKWGREPNEFAGQPITFRRSPLRVTVEVPAKGDKPAYDLTLFVVHHKSGQPGGYWREREAAKTVELTQDVVAKDPAANIIILGDFNSRPGDAPMAAYKGVGFIDAFADREPGNTKWYTHASDRAIDHILLNPNAAAEWNKDTRFILGTPQRPAKADWRSTPTPPGYASDHYPVVIDLIPVNKPVPPQPAPAPAASPSKPASSENAPPAQAPSTKP